MKKILSIALAFCLIFQGSAFAIPSNLSWTFAGWGGAGAYPQIYPDPSVSGKIWLISDVASIMKSTDSGDHWTWSNSEGLKNVGGSTMAQAPSNSSIFYHASGRSAGGGAIHSSTDGGVTWTNHGESANFLVDVNGHKAITVNRTDANTAYLGNNAGDIYRTTNRTTWSSWKTAAQVGIGKINVSVVDLTNTYLWVGGGSGLRRITLADGTVQTHTLTGTNATKNRDIVAINIAGTNYLFVAAGDRLAYTTDNGNNWNYTAVNSSITSSFHINRFAIQAGASLAASKIMVSTLNINNNYFSGGFRYKSSNGGSVWSSAAGTINYSVADDPTRDWTTGWNSSLSLVADPNVADRFYGSDFWGVFRTDNFGTTWNEKVKGAGNQVITDLKVAPDNSILASAMDDGLLRSADGGVSWKMLIPNLSGGQAYPEVAGHVWAFETLGTQSEWNTGNGVVAATNWCWDCSQKHKILRSTNQGGSQSNRGTWSVLTGIGIPNSSMFSGVWQDGYLRGSALDAQFTGGTTGKIWVSLDGYNTENGGIFQSTNGGQTFTRKTTDCSPKGCGNFGNNWRVYKAIAVNPTDTNNVIYATFGASGIWRTTNGGTSWSSPSSGNQYYMYKVEFGSDGTAYACGDANGPAVYRSFDKGNTWTAIWHGLPTSGPADGLIVDPSNPDRFVIGITAYDAKSPSHIFMTENARAANPTFTDVTGNLPSGQGMAVCAFRNSEGTQGYLYCGRYAGGIFKLNLASSTPSNQAPASSAGSDQTIMLPSTATLSASASDDGLPNPPGTLTYSWSKISGPGTVTFSDSTVLSPTATFSIDGSYVLRLTVSDSLLTGTDDVTITVQPSAPPTNLAPSSNAGSDQSVTLPSQANLAGMASDDGLPAPPGVTTYLWSKVSGPGTVTFSTATSLNTNASFSVDGSYVLRLSVTDSSLSSTDDTTITVNPRINFTPTSNAGDDKTVNLPQSASLIGAASDDGLPNPPGTTTVLWSKVSGPGTVTFSTATSLNTNASFSVGGVYVLRLTVNDSSLSATDDATITVNDISTPPAVRFTGTIDLKGQNVTITWS